MKILILSPLFPPDTAPSAIYVKELATRLSSHEVSILLYGHLPEKIPGVRLFCIDKRKSILGRAVSFIKKLNGSVRENEIVIIQNGPSVEFPSLFSLWFTKTPVILMESDISALERTNSQWLQKTIYSMLKKRANLVLSKENINIPPPKPLIHSLKENSDSEINSYERIWTEHLKKVEEILKEHV